MGLESSADASVSLFKADLTIKQVVHRLALSLHSKKVMVQTCQLTGGLSL